MTIAIMSNKDTCVACRDSSIALLLCLHSIAIIKCDPPERHAHLKQHTNWLPIAYSATVCRVAYSVSPNLSPPLNIQIPIDRQALVNRSSIPAVSSFRPYPTRCH
jgi:hypothetical protein